MGLHLLGPEIFDLIDISLKKVAELYGTSDVVPYIKILCQKMNFFVNQKLLSFADFHLFVNESISVQE